MIHHQFEAASVVFILHNVLYFTFGQYLDLKLSCKVGNVETRFIFYKIEKEKGGIPKKNFGKTAPHLAVMTCCLKMARFCVKKDTRRPSC